MSKTSIDVWNPVTGCTKIAMVARVGKKAAGRLLDGKEWNEYPQQL